MDDVLTYHIGPSKRVCRIVVSKKGLALGKGTYGELVNVGCIKNRVVGWGLRRTPMEGGGGRLKEFGVVECHV